jgi:hypothetical protein
MLTPHSTDVSGSQLLAWLESLLPAQNLDPAQEIGVRLAISELREFAEGPAMDAALDAQAETTRAECEDEHTDAIKALDKEHADELDAARAEAYQDGYGWGVVDAESAVESMLTLEGWEALLERCVYNADFGNAVYDVRAQREIAEAHAERERVARLEREQLAREQAFAAVHNHKTAVRKSTTPRKPRAKKAAVK